MDDLAELVPLLGGSLPRETPHRPRAGTKDGSFSPFSLGMATGAIGTGLGAQYAFVGPYRAISQRAYAGCRVTLRRGERAEGEGGEGIGGCPVVRLSRSRWFGDGPARARRRIKR